MATVTWNAFRDVAVAQRQSDSESFGMGAGQTLPIGLYSGYLYRSYWRFDYSFAGMTAITSAVLHLRTSSQVKVAFGGSPQITVQRVSADWPSTEGTATTLSTTNATEWTNQPTRTSTNERTPISVPSTENTWFTVNITNMLQDALAAGVWHGIGIRAVSESSSGDVTEFWSRESSSDAYVVVTYTTQAPPLAPTLVAPANNIDSVSRTPNLVFDHNDPDAMTMYDIQVGTDPNFVIGVTWNLVGGTTGISGNRATVPYGGSALANNTVYYWRARTKDALAYGPWATVFYFKTAQLPTVSVSEPSATGVNVKTSFVPGAGWGSPRINVEWTGTCPDGGTVDGYQVLIGTSSGGTQVVDSGMVSSTDQFYVCPTNVSDNVRVYIKVRVRCIHGETSAYSTERQVNVRFSLARFVKDLSTPPTAWEIAELLSNAPSGSDIQVEYGSNTSTTLPTTWYGSLASVPFNRYFFYRVWMMSWGTSPSPAPSFDKLVLEYTTTVVLPDYWQLPTGGSIDLATRVYGTQSLRIDGTGASTDRRAYQLVQVEPNTHYIFQCQVKALGTPNAQLIVSDTATGTGFAASAILNPSGGTFQRYTFEFDTGSRTAVYIQLGVFGGAGSSAWFDAAKLEASRVASTWTPGFLGAAVVLDAGGLAVDAYKGGIFRLRGASGGARDVVGMGNHGITWAADTELWSPSQGVIVLDGSGYDTDFKFRINADTGNLALLEFGEEGTYDTNLYRAAADRLKTDDAFEAGSLAIGANKVGRWVFGNFGTPVTNGGTTSDTAAGVTEATSVPATGVVALLLRCRLRNTGGTSGSTLAVQHWDGTTSLQLMAPAQNRDASGQAIVSSGGTNSRQFKWITSLGGQTNTYDIQVVGYLTVE